MARLHAVCGASRESAAGQCAAGTQLLEPEDHQLSVT